MVTYFNNKLRWVHLICCFRPKPWISLQSWFWLQLNLNFRKLNVLVERIKSVSICVYLKQIFVFVEFSRRGFWICSSRTSCWVVPEHVFVKTMKQLLFGKLWGKQNEQRQHFPILLTSESDCWEASEPSEDVY